MVKRHFGTLVHQFFKAHDPEDRHFEIELLEDKRVFVRCIFPLLQVDLVYDFMTDTAEIIVHDEEWVDDDEKVPVQKRGLLKQATFLWMGPGKVPSLVREVLTMEGINIVE